MTELIIIADKMDQLTPSEIKAMIAIFTEGKFLNTRDMMDLTGMTRKSCIKALDSDHVKEAVKFVQQNKDKNHRDRQISDIRKMLTKLESDAK